MSDQERPIGRAGDGLPKPEQGMEDVVNDVQEGVGLLRRFRVAGGERAPRLIMNNSTGAIRVRGEAAEESIALRAVKPNGETVPIDLVADVDLRYDGEIVVKARPFGDVQRQVKRITKSFDFNRSDFLDNLGDMIDTLAQMKSAGRNIGQVVLEATVPMRCDLELTTASGAINVQGVTGEIELKSASGKIETRQLGGKLAVRTASGDVRADGVDGTAYLQSVSGTVEAYGIGGDVVIHTTSGDTRARGITGQLGFKSLSGELSVDRSRLNGFYINTTSGECTIDAHLEPGGYEMRTVSGDLSLRLQPDFAGILSGRTVSGSFRCDLPFRYASDDWRSQLDDDDERGSDADDSSSDDDAEISLPGIKISKGRVELPGIKIDDRGVGVFGMRIDDNGINMPGLGVHIGKEKWDRWERRSERDAEREQRRERRRSRNRWEYLIGDPAAAEGGQTRLRIRTVSGSVNIRQGRGDVMSETSIAAIAARAASAPGTPAAPAARPAADQRGWPDSEMWPHAETGAIPTPPTPPTAPLAPLAPQPPALPTPPTPPTPPSPPTLSGEARSAAGEADTPLSASPVAEAAAEAENTAAASSVIETTVTADTPTEDAPPPVAESVIAAPAPVANPERTRLDILEALERGEINADEALRLLRRLEI
ncbi:MAG: DUF4097 family beta strand repeat-containing protein [Chloroflexia bacterium]